MQAEMMVSGTTAEEGRVAAHEGKYGKTRAGGVRAATAADRDGARHTRGHWYMVGEAELYMSHEF